MSNTYSSRPDIEAPSDPFEFDMDVDTDHADHFVCDGGVSLLDLSELAGLADAEAASAEGIAAIAGVFRGAMSPDTYARFKGYTRRWHTDPDVLLEIMKDMVVYATAGPTRRPSPSPRGSHVIDGGWSDSAGSPASPFPEGELSEETVARIREGLAAQTG